MTKLYEENDPFAMTPPGSYELSKNDSGGHVDIENDSVRDNINNLLAAVTASPAISPYTALERVRKVLAQFHINLPAHTFMEGSSGSTTFEINQFGSRIGMTDGGEVVTKGASGFTLYFEYEAQLDGKYAVFAEICDDDELQEILDDVEDEIEDAEMNEAKRLTKGQKIIQKLTAKKDSDKWKGHIETGPHQSDEHEVKAKSRDDAVKKITKKAKSYKQHTEVSPSTFHNVQKYGDIRDKYGKKEIQEDAEMNEVSSKTLRSYYKKRTQKSNNDYGLPYERGLYDFTDKEAEKEQRGEKGLDRAADRLKGKWKPKKKLNEVSSNTLANYKSKALPDEKKRMHALADKYHKDPLRTDPKEGRKWINRNKGLNRAERLLSKNRTKEKLKDVYTKEENLQEISKKAAWIYAMASKEDLEANKKDPKRATKRAKGLSHVAHKLIGIPKEKKNLQELTGKGSLEKIEKHHYDRFKDYLRKSDTVDRDDPKNAWTKKKGYGKVKGTPAGDKAFEPGQKSLEKSLRATRLKLKRDNLQEDIATKLKGFIRRQKSKSSVLQNRRDVAHEKAASAYSAGKKRQGDKYMKWREKNAKKNGVDLRHPG
tara:strand:- start:22557 stop:24347 length:1791 start_codon:yes stop_codon:yes gene_type:complete